nr:GGDEF domain-containing protein [Butyrivibrio sp.]
SFISLPRNYKNKELKIYAYLQSSDVFSVYNIPFFGNYDDIKRDFIYRKIYPISVGISMITFGLTFMLISILAYYKEPEILSLVYNSMLCTVIGIWILCYYNVTFLFLNVTYETTLEYISMYTIVPLSFLILKTINKSYFKIQIDIITYISALVSIVLIALHFLHIVPINRGLPLYHVFIILGFASLLVVRNMDLQKREFSESHRTILRSILTFILFFFAQMVVYFLQLWNLIEPNVLTDSFLATGGLTIVAAQTYNYLVYIADSFARKQENASLTHLAYADGLTNLSNRSMSEKIMADLDKEDIDYCIISMDLNGLKTINDEYGHVAGDKYITDFAKILTNCFEPFGTCCRIGGDEFIIIIPETTEDNVIALIEKAKSALGVLNALYAGFTRSVACGYAFKHDYPDDDAHTIYLKADENMYAQKKKMHKELGILTRV